MATEICLSVVEDNSFIPAYLFTPRRGMVQVTFRGTVVQFIAASTIPLASMRPNPT